MKPSGTILEASLCRQVKICTSVTECSLLLYKLGVHIENFDIDIARV